MSKYTVKRIEEITKYMNETIPAAINEGITVQKYLNEHRTTLNLSIIQAIFGAEFIKGENDGDVQKVKINHRPADVTELAQITHLLNDFIANVENPFLASSDEVIVVTEDDMDIPARASAIAAAALPQINKFNNKNIQNYIFGNDDPGAALSHKMITGMDVYDLAAVAKKIHTHKLRNTMLIIGGVALILTGGIVATGMLIKGRGEEAATNEEGAIINDDGVEINDDGVDINDDVEINDVDINDDVPSVQMD